MINKITDNITPSTGLLQDTKSDVRAIMKYCNMLQEKINELIVTVNKLEKERVEPKTNTRVKK